MSTLPTDLHTQPPVGSSWHTVFQLWIYRTVCQIAKQIPSDYGYLSENPVPIFWYHNQVNYSSKKNFLFLDEVVFFTLRLIQAHILLPSRQRPVKTGQNIASNSEKQDLMLVARTVKNKLGGSGGMAQHLLLLQISWVWLPALAR